MSVGITRMTTTKEKTINVRRNQMPSNLSFYSKVCELKDCLELRDTQGKEMTEKALRQAIKLVNKIFAILERRKNDA